MRRRLEKGEIREGGVGANRVGRIRLGRGGGSAEERGQIWRSAVRRLMLETPSSAHAFFTCLIPTPAARHPSGEGPQARLHKETLCRSPYREKCLQVFREKPPNRHQEAF